MFRSNSLIDVKSSANISAVFVDIKIVWCDSNTHLFFSDMLINYDLNYKNQTVQK